MEELTKFTGAAFDSLNCTGTSGREVGDADTSGGSRQMDEVVEPGSCNMNDNKDVGCEERRSPVIAKKIKSQLAEAVAKKTRKNEYAEVLPTTVSFAQREGPVQCDSFLPGNYLVSFLYIICSLW